MSEKEREAKLQELLSLVEQKRRISTNHIEQAREFIRQAEVELAIFITKFWCQGKGKEYKDKENKELLMAQQAVRDCDVLMTQLKPICPHPSREKVYLGETCTVCGKNTFSG